MSANNDDLLRQVVPDYFNFNINEVLAPRPILLPCRGQPAPTSDCSMNLVASQSEA
jgi:hypothetical protein